MHDRNMARVFRDMVRDLFRHAPEEIRHDDAAFLAFLGVQYRDCRRKLDDRPSDDTERVGLFICAAGLLTFGRLDRGIVDAILTRPVLLGGIDRLAGTVPALLPLPDDIKSSKDPVATRRWIDAHAHRLTFSEELGRFVLTD